MHFPTVLDAGGTLLTVVALAGCAYGSDSVSAQYVSPLAYDAYSCDQIRQERSRGFPAA